MIEAEIETNRTVTCCDRGCDKDNEGAVQGCHRGCDRDWDRNVTNSAITVRVGTTAPEPRPTLSQPVEQLVVTAATQQTGTTRPRHLRNRQ